MTLTKQQRYWLVEQFAKGDGLAEVVAAFYGEFGERITSQQAWNWDPGRPLNRKKLARAFVEHYDEIRAAWKEGRIDEVINEKLWRQRERRKLIQAEQKRNFPNKVLIRELLNDAAKEAGEYFTNHRILTGPNGQPLPSAVTMIGMDLAALTQAELETILPIAERLHGCATPAGDSA
jgi:hypothetical protein